MGAVFMAPIFLLYNYCFFLISIGSIKNKFEYLHTFEYSSTLKRSKNEISYTENRNIKS